MRRTTTILTLAASCAALAIAPSAATAKTVTFAGPVDLPFIPSVNGFAVDVPAIEMKVTFRGKNVKAVVGGTLKAEGLYGPCAPGSSGCNDSGKEPEPGGLPREAPQCFGLQTKFNDQITVKNKRFSDIYRDLSLSDAPPAVRDKNFFKVTGRVTKSSVTGTVQARTYYPAGVVTTGTTNTFQPEESCDTGVLTYTARR